jgi:hypothetical protein
LFYAHNIEQRQKSGQHFRSKPELEKQMAKSDSEVAQTIENISTAME